MQTRYAALPKANASQQRSDFSVLNGSSGSASTTCRGASAAALFVACGPKLGTADDASGCPCHSRGSTRDASWVFGVLLATKVRALGWRIGAILPISALVLWAIAVPCAAESRIEVPYSRAEVWQAVQRFCAVDLEGEISTSDQEAGFLVFTFQHASGPQRGSFEVFTPSRGSTPVLVLRLSQLPSYMERLYLKKVLDKVERQLGPPLRPRAAAPASDDAPKENPVEGAAP